MTSPSLRAAARPMHLLKASIAVLGIVLASLALKAPAASAATTLYVDASSVGGTCSDARTAAQVTLTTPWCSLATALRAAPDGSVVAVRRGTYPKLVLSGLTRTGYVSVTPYGTESPVIPGIDLDKVSKVRLSNLRITAQVVLRSSTDLQLIDNEITVPLAGLNTGTGVDIRGSQRIVVAHNWIHDVMNGVTLNHGGPMLNGDVVVWGNRLQDLGGNGVIVNRNSQRILVAANDFDAVKPRADMNPSSTSAAMLGIGPIDRLSLWGNRVHGGGRGFLLSVSSDYANAAGAGLTNTYIANNVFSESSDFALRTFSTPGARILNNTAWNTGSGGIDIRSRSGTANAASTGMVLANNITNNMAIDPAVTFAYRDHNVLVKGALGGSHDRIGTPVFEDPAAGDFRLAPGSLGLNGADPARAVSLDMHGRARTDAPDLGAVERSYAAPASFASALPAEVTSLLNGSGATADIQQQLRPLAAHEVAAAASTLYVDVNSLGGTCSDSRTAAQVTLTTPWCSLAAALRAAPRDGTVIAVRAGSYPKLVVADQARTGYVKVMPYEAETPTIAGMDLSRVSLMRFEGLRFTAGVYVRTASDMQFVGNEVSATPAGLATESGFSTAALKRGLFLGNWVHDAMNGIVVTADSSVPNSDLTIWGNLLQNLGNDGVGINVGSSRILVARNDIDNVKPRADMKPDAHADAIQALAPSSGITVWGNRVRGGGRGFLFMVSASREHVADAALTGLLVQNNLFHDSQDFGIRSFSTPGARFLNNTSWQLNRGGIDLHDRRGTVNAHSTGMTLANNITRNLYVEAGTTFTHRDSNLMVRGPLSGPADRLGTPVFEDPAAGDYRLQATSPGVDAADTAMAPLLDMLGRGRADRADLGALERASLPLADPFASLPPEVASVVNASGATVDVQRALTLGR